MASMARRIFPWMALLATLACSGEPAYDVVIRGGTVYDGSGGAPVVADVAVLGDSIVLVGDVPEKDERRSTPREWPFPPGSSTC